MLLTLRKKRETQCPTNTHLLRVAVLAILALFLVGQATFGASTASSAAPLLPCFQARG